ncbi:MAG: glucosyltransferase domain-containing protein [Lachnospiraceae bacterium]
MLFFKKQLHSIYKQYCLFVIYLSSTRIAPIFFLITLLLTYGSQAFTTNYYVDSEIVINISETTYNWYEIGRHGLVFTKWLLNTTWYNPYYTGLLFLAFLWLSATLFYYTITKILPHTHRALIAIGSMLLITYPTFTEQYYFHFQSAEIAFGLFLCIICMGTFYLFTENQEPLWLLFPMPLLALVFSIYQSFIPFTLCSYLFIFVVRMYQSLESAEITNKAISSIWGSILQFAVSFTVSQLINFLFFKSEDYLSSQIIWSTDGTFIEKLKNIIITCANAFIGKGIFYTSLLLIACVVVSIFFTSYHFSSIHKNILTFLGILGIILTPFILTFILGSNVAIRSQFTFGYSAVCLLLLSFEFGLCTISFRTLRTHTYCVYSVIIVLSLFLIMQVKDCNDIFATNQEICDSDYDLGTQLIAQLYDSYAVKDQVPITFWGHLQPETSYSEITENNVSYLFLSVYNLEYDTEPLCFFSTNRILGYFETLGYKFVYPTSQSRSMSEYIINVDQLPAFPAEGNMNQLPQSVTINLGDGTTSE